MQVLCELRFRGQPCGLARLVNHLRGLVCRLLCQLLLEVSDTAVFLGDSLGLCGDLVVECLEVRFQLVGLFGCQRETLVCQHELLLLHSQGNGKQGE